MLDNKLECKGSAGGDNGNNSENEVAEWNEA